MLLLMGARTAVNAQELTVSDIQFTNLHRYSDNTSIVLTKEGSILNVQLLNYPGHPSTQEFVITPKMSGGSDGEPYSVFIDVIPINISDTDVITTFNVSFNVHGLEINSFHFSCWPYEEQVNLTEGEPLVLDNILENVTMDYIDGFAYSLHKESYTATFVAVDWYTTGMSIFDDLKIPSELEYEGQKYTVTGIYTYTFARNTRLTCVTIPSSLEHIGGYAFYGCDNLVDFYCYADNVPVTGAEVFGETPIASATLHVPAGSLEKYKTTSPWSEFGNIVALSPDLTQIRIKDRPSEVLEYIGKIGSDFDTALDSLRILKSISSDIKIEPLEVIFDYDNRLFFGIIYGDCGMYSDVLDTKGNYYLRTWYSPAEDPVTYIKDQMATIILPTEPDASKGKYYRLDRCEDNQIIFEQELQPRARVPYIIVPAEDFSIDPNALNLEGLHSDTVSVEGVSFIGSYVREELPTLTGEDGVESSYIDFIDTTPDCGPSISAETGKESLLIGTLRAYLIVKWDDPIDHGSPSVPPFGKKEIVLHNYSTGINSLTPDPSPRRGEVFDLQGRRIDNSKLPRGIYIKDGKKVVVCPISR